MYCRVLACDFDGTIADDGRIAPEVVTALGDARARGIAVILVTGRVLEDLRLANVDLGGFDAVVAENGAVVYLPEQARSIQLGGPPPERFLGELRARGVPFHAGAVVIGISDRHAAQVLDLVRTFGLDCQLIFNRAALMLLPSGVSKATGVRRALEELGRSEHNMIAFGDAENDLPLLTVAQVGVSAHGAVPALDAVADDRLTQPGGAGVAQYVRRLLDRGGIAETSERTGVTVGEDSDGIPTILPGSGLNIMITGDPRAGKSWLAGLFAERLLEAGYRLCIIDPEGDHIALGKRPRVLVLGHTVPLPASGSAPAVLHDTGLSLVLNLASLPHSAKLAYVDEVLCALQGVRAETGIPPWIIVDEAHYFCHDASPCVCARRFDRRTGNFVFVTYRPSLVADPIHDGVGAYLIAPTAIEEERYFMTGLLRARGPHDVVVHDALGELERQRVGLLRLDGARPNWRNFTPGARMSVHTHHGRKYADAWLPEDRAFRFLGGNGSVIATAHNLIEFCGAVKSVGMDSLRHHLLHGDFSRWAAGVLGDSELAAGLQKLEQTTRVGATPSRDEIIAHVRDRYFI
jgi:hydroxymethylpyrimidine pyrophosphatase-like HAD family hydrolase